MAKKQPAEARNARAAAREGEKVTTTWRRLSSAEVRSGDGQDRLELEFGGEIFQWRGPAPYYFVTVPEEPSAELKAASAGTSYYRGKLRVQARIGDTEWPTSMWPKDGRYLVPIRDSVRKPRGGSPTGIRSRSTSPWPSQRWRRGRIPLGHVLLKPLAKRTREPGDANQVAETING